MYIEKVTIFRSVESRPETLPTPEGKVTALYLRAHAAAQERIFFFFLKEKEVCFDRTRNFLWAADDDVALPHDAHNSFYRSSIHVYPAPFFFSPCQPNVFVFLLLLLLFKLLFVFSSDAKCGGLEDSVEKLRQKHFFFPFSIHDWPYYTWVKYMKLSMIFLKIISAFHDGFCSESSLM